MGMTNRERMLAVLRGIATALFTPSGHWKVSYPEIFRAIQDHGRG